MQGISATCRVVGQFIIMLHRETTLGDGQPIVSGYMPGECDTLLPDVNVPVVRINTRYDFNAKTRSGAIGTNCNLWGYEVPFSRDVLKKLYPTHDAYVRQVKSQTGQLVKSGWITEVDGRHLIVAAEKSSIPEPENPFLVPLQPS